jgi:hypothetical protein
LVSYFASEKTEVDMMIRNLISQIIYTSSDFKVHSHNTTTILSGYLGRVGELWIMAYYFTYLPSQNYPKVKNEYAYTTTKIRASFFFFF